MSEKKWKVEFEENAPWHSIVDGKSHSGTGIYTLTFDGNKYGFISKNAWDDLNTGEILAVVERMLNDANQLAIRIN